MLPLRYPMFWLAGGILAMAVVLVLALIPSSRFTAVMFGFISDKTSHFLAFAALMTWFCGVFRLPMTPLVAVGLVAFGVLIELLQSFMPYRTSDLRDVLADVYGIGAGWTIALVGVRHWTRWVEMLLPDRLSP